MNLTCVDSAEISTALEPPFCFAIWSSCTAQRMQSHDSCRAQRGMDPSCWCCLSLLSSKKVQWPTSGAHTSVLL